MTVLPAEGETEEALLVAAPDERADVEERRWEHLAAVVDQDAPRLLHDEEAARAVAGVSDAKREAQTGGDRLEAEGDLRRRASARPHAGRHGDEERRAGAGHAATTRRRSRCA